MTAKESFPAVIGFVGVAIGALIAGGLGLLTTHLEIGEAHAKEARDVKAKTYAEYIDAAELWSMRSLQYDDWLKTATPADYARRNNTIIDGPAKNFYAARDNFHDKAVRLRVYASKEAWQTHLIMTSIMPPNEVERDFKRVDTAQFTRVSDSFLMFFCRDVNPEAPKECEEAKVLEPGQSSASPR